MIEQKLFAIDDCPNNIFEGLAFIGGTIIHVLACSLKFAGGGGTTKGCKVKFVNQFW
jgi:hypothetical protein